MKLHLPLALACFTLAAQALVFSQTSPAPQPAPNELHRQTSLVIVPALVREKSGRLLFTLTADDFVLTDDGVPQKLILEPDTGGEPIALVVVVEVGGAGAREFGKLGALPKMLDAVVGNVRHSVAVVAFDSEARLAQRFTPGIESAANAIRDLTACGQRHRNGECDPADPEKADNGAAILDSLGFAIDLLRDRPPAYRRAILLLSETLDRGSSVTLEQAVRAVSDENVAIYSIGFSTAKSEAAHYGYRELPYNKDGGLSNAYPNPPHGCMGKNTDSDPDLTHSKLAQFYDCLSQLAPPLGLAKMAAIAATDSMHRNVPETVAQLTGGEYFKLTDAKSLERSLTAISNHLPNRYVLSFHPEAPHPGLHILGLHLPKYANIQVTARASYWASSDGLDDAAGK